MLIPILSIFAFSIKVNTLSAAAFYFIMPQYLSIMKPWTIPFLILFLYILILKNLNKQNLEIHSTKSLEKKSDKECKLDTRMFFDFIRFLTITQTTICIFLCDFSFWTKRFSKNDYFQVGLMDLGVGCFIFNGGIISKKTTTRKMAKSTMILLLLGFVRLFTVLVFDLDVNPNEYGIHWNFYFTLAVVNMLFIPINMYTTRLVNISIGATILAVYEYMTPVLTPVLFNENRTVFVLQNKEGLASIIPFLGFFLVLNGISDYLLEKDVNKAIKNTSKIWFINLAIYFVTRLYSSPSRKLCNLGYISWVMFLDLSVFLLYMLICNLRPTLIGRIDLIKLCSQKMLDIFLFSNLLVLVFKKCFELEKMSFLAGNMLNISYLALNFISLPYIQSKRQVKYEKKKKE
ncbi:hypothetical protein GINT2_000826 [Glugoides intestinalis]